MGATKQDMKLYGGKTADALEKDGYSRKDANRMRGKYGAELKPETGSTPGSTPGRQVTKPLEDVSDEDKRKQAIGRRQGTLTRSLLG